jgi:hypothetical protein
VIDVTVVIPSILPRRAMLKRAIGSVLGQTRQRAVTTSPSPCRPYRHPLAPLTFTGITSQSCP